MRYLVRRCDRIHIRLNHRREDIPGDRAGLVRLLDVLPLSEAERADFRLDLANPFVAGGPSGADAMMSRW